MFRDFPDSGPKFKTLIFYILKRIYEEEEIPESFLVTVLIPLFKKGNPMLAENYRYLHIREDIARLFEYMLYAKLEVTYDFTPEFQLGGMRSGDCVEHLALMTNVINAMEKEGKGNIFLCADMEKCFYMFHLTHSQYFMITNDCDLKAAKVYYELIGNNNLKIQGAEEMFNIRDGQGQGGVNAARQISGAGAEVIQRYTETHPDPFTFRGENLSVDQFVDNTKSTDTTAEGAIASGNIITSTFNELALSAHPKKTVLIVSGDKDYIKDTREKLKLNPPRSKDLMS